MTNTHAAPRTPHYSLITGASRGLGRATALHLAARGSHILALARTQGALAALDDEVKKAGGHATLLPFDLTAPEEAFAQLGETLFHRFGRLDTLVLNAAAIGPLSPLPHVQEADWQKVMAVNLTANVRLLRVLEPLLRAAQNPMVAFVSCAEAAMGHAFWGPYAASKKALEKLAESYAEETKTFGFRVSLHHPGPMPTRLRREAFPGEDQTVLPPLAPLLL